MDAEIIRLLLFDGRVSRPFPLVALVALASLLVPAPDIIIIIIMSGLFKFGVVQLNPRLHGDYKAP